MKQDNKEALLFFIDGKRFETFEQYMTGAGLKKLAGIPDHVKLYLAVQEGYEPELIENDKEVDLARKDIEHFFVKDKLKFTINGEPFISYVQYIKGSHIRKLGNIPADDDIYLTNVPPYKDDLIKDDEEVDLARPGREHFISKANPNIKLTIQTPKGNWTDSFDKNLTIQELINKVVVKFGFTADGNYALKIKGATENMVVTQTIASYDLPNGQILVFTDLGKGA
jgi:hypothetical protein